MKIIKYYNFDTINQQKLMKGSYNPFSKTYQYLCFQQQIAHKKNLKTVQSKNQSNVKIVQKTPTRSRTSKTNQSQCSLRQSQIIQPYLAIHKNKAYQNKQNQKRIQQNRRMAATLMKTSCSVITRDDSLKSYEDYKTYQQISRKFSKSGVSKQFLNIDLSSSIFSRKSHKFSGKKTGTPSIKSIQQPKYSSYNDEHMKPRYK